MFRKLFAVLLISCVLLGAALADSGSPPSSSTQYASEAPQAPGVESSQSDSDTWQATERKYEYEVSGQEFKAKAGFRSTDLNVRRGIKFEGKVDQEGLRVYARFYNRETDSVSMYSVKIRVRDMIEYVPASNTTTGYAQGDTIVRSLTSGWTWKPVVQDSVSSNTSAFARQMSVSTQDGAFTAVIKFNLPDNSSLAASANDMKIDFIIDNAALKAAGWLTDPKSLIALKGVIQTGSNMEHRLEQVGTEVEGVQVAPTTASFAAFQWTNFIECGSALRKVKVATSKLIDDSSNSEHHESSDEDNGSSRANVIYWSFLNDQTVSGGEKCLWDPAIKVQSDATRAIGSVFAFVGLLLVALLL